MRSSSAMPALSPLKLDTKSSLLPAAAADAATAAAEAAAALPRSQTIAAPVTQGQGAVIEPSLDAKSKTGVCYIDLHFWNQALVRCLVQLLREILPFISTAYLLFMAVCSGRLTVYHCNSNLQRAELALPEACITRLHRSIPNHCSISLSCCTIPSALQL